MARPRKPTEVKAAQGTLQKCRSNPNEPQPIKGKPVPPAHLSGRAAAVWPQVCDVFHQAGILTSMDALAVEGLCISYADKIIADAAVAKLGGEVTYETTGRDGNTMKRAHPEIAVAAEADRRFRMWLAAFGATPSDRSRVSVVKEPDDQEDFTIYLTR